MERIECALGLAVAATDDVLCPNSINQRDTGWDGNEAEVMITNEEGGNDESWILTGGVVQGPPQAQQMMAPTIARANVLQGLATAQNQGPQPQQQPAAHQQQQQPAATQTQADFSGLGHALNWMGHTMYM